MPVSVLSTAKARVELSTVCRLDAQASPLEILVARWEAQSDAPISYDGRLVTPP